jgi:hypothetical protein
MIMPFPATSLSITRSHGMSSRPRELRSTLNQLRTPFTHDGLKLRTVPQRVRIASSARSEAEHDAHVVGDLLVDGPPSGDVVGAARAGVPPCKQKVRNASTLVRHTPTVRKAAARAPHVLRVSFDRLACFAPAAHCVEKRHPAAYMRRGSANKPWSVPDYSGLKSTIVPNVDH